MEHKPTCQAIKDRKALTAAIRNASIPRPGLGSLDKRLDGSQEQLDREFSVLSGIVAEYADDGDQVLENCTCADPYSIAINACRTALSEGIEGEGRMSGDELKNLVAIEEFIRIRDNA